MLSSSKILKVKILLKLRPLLTIYCHMVSRDAVIGFKDGFDSGNLSSACALLAANRSVFFHLNAKAGQTQPQGRKKRHIAIFFAESFIKA